MGVQSLWRWGVTCPCHFCTQLRHPNVVRLVDYYNERGHVILVQELVRGGELYHRIVKHGGYSERIAREYVVSIVRAVEYCHKKNVIHRDLKVWRNRGVLCAP